MSQALSEHPRKRFLRKKIQKQMFNEVFTVLAQEKQLSLCALVFKGWENMLRDTALEPWVVVSTKSFLYGKTGLSQVQPLRLRPIAKAIHKQSLGIFHPTLLHQPDLTALLKNEMLISTSQVKAHIPPGPQSHSYKSSTLKASDEVQKMTQKAGVRSSALPK